MKCQGVVQIRMVRDVHVGALAAGKNPKTHRFTKIMPHLPLLICPSPPGREQIDDCRLSQQFRIFLAARQDRSGVTNQCDRISRVLYQLCHLLCTQSYRRCNITVSIRFLYHHQHAGTFGKGCLLGNQIKGERGKAWKQEGPREYWEKGQVLWICRGDGVFPSRVIRDEYRI